MNKKFQIIWMSCISCVNLNKKVLLKQKWINKVSINLATWKVSINYDKKIISFSEIKKIINKNWFKVSEKIKQRKNKYSNKRFFVFFFSLMLALPIFWITLKKTFFWIEILWVDLSLFLVSFLSALIVFIFWFHFHFKALKSLTRFKFDMNSLVSLWTLTAFFYSIVAIFIDNMPTYFEASVVIIILINLWRYLEHKAKLKAGDVIWKFKKLWVKEALVIRWDKFKKENIWNIKVWDILKVKPGEKIPLDGVIIKWNTNINESMLTWESIPVFKEVNNNCFWWTLNLDWEIIIKVKKTIKDWTLSQIINLIEKAQNSRVPIQKITDKISSIFVPIIIVIAIVTFIFWIIFTGDIFKAISASVSTLIIACPCALWLAVPTAVIIWTWVWAKMWILIKNAKTLEKTKKIDYVVFDKTWTLTTGKPIVTELISFWMKKDLLIKYARSLANLSNHPLSKAILKYKKNIDFIEITKFKEIKWKWIIWQIRGELFYLWNKTLLKDIKIKKEIEEKVLELSKKWKTPVLIWKWNNIIWLIWILDSPKEWVKIIIRELRYRKIEIVMLTWDTEETANYIANKIWIKKVISEVMPKDKLKAIKEIQSRWFKVAFVWDWINDAPALVQSDLWIVMWTGSSIAIESSDIVLVKWDLFKIVSAISLSRRILKAIKQNLFWAFIYNLIWIPLAVFGLLNPIIASIAMVLSSFSVVLNSLRIKKFKPFYYKFYNYK